jgi:peptide deformylase
MAELSEEDQRILDYLRDSVAKGDRYFRAKRIAKGVGLTAKQVGVRLPRLADSTDDVDIEKWGRAKSTTWRVTPGA